MTAEDAAAALLGRARRNVAAVGPLPDSLRPADEAGGWRVEEEFISAIRGQEEITHTDFATGVKYMEFTEAVHRSRRSGAAVSLPLL